MLPQKKILATSEVIASSGTFTTDPVSIADVSGTITICLKVVGSGTLTLDYELGPTPDTTYVEPGVAKDQGNLATALVAGGAEYCWQANIQYSELTRFILTANTAEVTATLWIYTR